MGVTAIVSLAAIAAGFLLTLGYLALGLVWRPLQGDPEGRAGVEKEERRQLISRLFVIGAALLFVAWSAALVIPRPRKAKDAEPRAVLAVTTGEIKATCASVDPGMTAREVEALVGKPDDVRSAQDVRGPGAERWTYRGGGCQVHFLDGVVEFVN